MPAARIPRPLCEVIHRLERLCGHPPEPPPADDLGCRSALAIRRATGFLIASQDGDGAWRGHGDDDFSNGHALTAHVLRALRSVPQPAEVGDAVASGFDFAETICPDGRSIDTGSPPLPYPVTAVAGTLSVLATSRRRRRDELVPALVRYLCEAQYDERAGYGPDELEYGGFGYQPARPRDDPGERIPELQYPHLSAAIFVVEALALSGHPDAAPALAKARRFVERCQNYSEAPDAPGDGGFVFSPAIASLNKAGAEAGNPTGFRSYGTMTANGLRLLAHLGYPAGHPRFRAAAVWLRENFRADAVPGAFAADARESQASVWYYYCWTASQALDAVGEPTVRTRTGEVAWARAIATELVARQLPDGTWRNQASARKESVLPIADMIALPALATCQRHLSGAGQAP